MAGPLKDRRLQAGWTIFAVLGLLAMALSVIFATMPMRGEEEFAGTTYQELRAANPRLADVIWHDTVAFWVLSFGVSLLGFVLAWKGLSKGSALAWYGLLILGVTYVATILLAHVPVGNTSVDHIGLAYVLIPVYVVALGLSARPVFAAAKGAKAPSP